MSIASVRTQRCTRCGHSRSQPSPTPLTLGVDRAPGPASLLPPNCSPKRPSSGDGSVLSTHPNNVWILPSAGQAEGRAQESVDGVEVGGNAWDEGLGREVRKSGENR